MSLPEDLRQEYLRAIGIESYFPRRKLPGAPVSKTCQWPASWRVPAPKAAEEQPAPESPAVIPASRREQPAPTASRQATAQAKPGIIDAIAPDNTPAPQAPEKPARNREDFRLQLLCARVNDHLALLIALPHLGSGQLSAQQRNLLQNMLRFSAITSDQLLIEAEPFHWPMVQGGQVDNSSTAAASALLAYLEQKYTDWQFDALLVLGEQAVQPLFFSGKQGDDGSDSNNAEYATRKPTPQVSSPKQWRTFYTRSLDEALHSPVLKKELWAAICKLKS